MDPTQARTIVGALAPKDWRAAETKARNIGDPWFRCQSLAKVSLHAADSSNQQRVLVLAVSAAYKCDEPNRIVSVGAWPVKAAVLLAHIQFARTTTEGLLQNLTQESSPVRRSDALYRLLGACAALPQNEPLFWTVYKQLVSAATEPLLSGKRNQKGQSNLAQLAGHIYSRDPKKAAELLELLEGPTHRQHAEEQIRLGRATVHGPNL